MSLVTSPKGRRVAGWLALVVTLSLAGAFVYWVWGPGIPSNDTSGQISQYLTGYYTDWQSPVLSVLWGWSFALLGYPAGPFMFNLVLMLGAVGFWVSLVPVRWAWRCLIATIVILWPSTFLLFSQDVKDVPYAAALLLAVALSIRARRARVRHRWPWVVSTAVCLVAVVSFRLEGIVSALPICVLLVALVPPRWGPWRWGDRSRGRRLVTLLIGTGLVAAALYETSSVIEYDVMGTVRVAPYQATLLWDLSALSASTGRVLVPGGFQHDTPISFFRIYDSSFYCDLLFYPRVRNVVDSNQVLIFRHDPKDLSELRDAWVHAVLHHPLAYLHHRLAILNWTLEVTHDQPYGLVAPLDAASDPDYYCEAEVHVKCGVPTSAGARWFEARGTADRGWVIFRDWPYTLASLAVLILCLWKRRRSDLLAVVLASSGILEIVVLFFASPGAGYRYTEWPMVAAVTAVVSYLCGQSRASRRSAVERGAPPVG